MKVNEHLESSCEFVSQINSKKDFRVSFLFFYTKDVDEVHQRKKV